MTRSTGIWRLSAVLGLIGAIFPASAAWAEYQTGTALKPTDAVKTLTVKIDVASDSKNLDEPVALDLGLGFPLWLGRVGRKPAEAVPFGAVPQKATATDTVAAGSSATFTFELSGETGDDAFLTTGQLLDGVQVSDVARIGFAGRGDTNWTLAGYEIRVNGELLASNDAVKQKAGDSQQEAQLEIADLGLKIAPLKKEAEDLKALDEAKLATDKDLEKLADTEKKLQPLAEQLKRLEGQVAGRYPWFQEAKFQPDWLAKASAKSVKVTLLTAAHAGADTKNYVYFRTGGKKYLLASPESPLAASFGPQTFELDLLAGPLSASEIRGFMLGMLAQPSPYGEGPDRWHPERLRVEVDDGVVYDSEEYPFDLKSLEAIRLIPPVHLDQDGKFVSNKEHTVREVFVWEAGKGQGLDPSTAARCRCPTRKTPAIPRRSPDCRRTWIRASPARKCCRTRAFPRTRALGPMRAFPERTTGTRRMMARVVAVVVAAVDSGCPAVEVAAGCGRCRGRGLPAAAPIRLRPEIRRR